jgi:pimeloyl-ACP methyl ester carboxylesterase
MVGWDSGGHWAGLYATRHPAKVAALVLYNVVYGGGPAHTALIKALDLANPQQPEAFNRQAYGAYRVVEVAALIRSWDAEIRGADKTAWRDPGVLTAFVREILAGEPPPGPRASPSIRVPSGAFADTFEAASGRRPWDAGLVQCRTLVVASERDTWSRAEDRDRLKAHLVNAPAAEVVVLADATHFAHLDRPARGREALLNALVGFLKPSPAAPRR